MSKSTFDFFSKFNNKKKRINKYINTNLTKSDINLKTKK